MTDYDYVQLVAARGAPARRDLIAHLSSAKTHAAGSGCELLGLFTAQLGWDAVEMALLVRWTGDRRERVLEDVLVAPQILSHTIQRLSPTVRPAGAAVLPAGGIYVHRWFEVAGGDIDEFVHLSQEAWKDFEPRFDAHVFGLFLAGETDVDRRGSSRRILLLTRYADHGVWEASRDPSTEAMRTFGRRALITLNSRGASTLMVPL